MDFASGPLHSCVDGMKGLAHSLRGECQPRFAPPRAPTGFAPRSGAIGISYSRPALLLWTSPTLLRGPRMRPRGKADPPGGMFRVWGRGVDQRADLHLCVGPHKIPLEETCTDSAPPCFCPPALFMRATSSATFGTGTRLASPAATGRGNDPSILGTRLVEARAVF
jgi:hypothetical protein